MKRIQILPIISILAILLSTKAFSMTLSSSISKNGIFYNLQPSINVEGKADWGEFKKKRKLIEKKIKSTPIPPDHILPKEKSLELLKLLSNKNSITWIGHASFLIQLNGINILTDPLFSSNTGPLWFGPKRIVNPGIELSSIPKIDIIIISHSHYDHLDKASLSKMPNKEEITVYVPLNLSGFFKKIGYKKIIELDWLETHQFNDKTNIRLLPSHHWSQRTLFDRNKTLWGSYQIRTDGYNIYFMGDSAYSKIFKEIGKLSGPYNLAILGIGAYEPETIMKNSHTTPEEAVQVGKDIDAENILAMHWGTVILSTEDPWEPPSRFKRAGEKEGYLEENIWIMKIGESKELR